jgi:transposase
LPARIAALAAQVEELRRRLDKDSSTSSRPPSSDGPYRKPRDRSLRTKTGRRPGKQPGSPSSTLRQSGNPGEIIGCPPPACCRCGTGLAGVAVLAVQKLQVHEVAPPPPPRVTEYQVQSKACPRCGEVTPGTAPRGVTGRRWPAARITCRSPAPPCWSPR